MIRVSKTTLEDIHKVSHNLKEIFDGDVEVIPSLIAHAEAGRCWTVSDPDGDIGCIQGYSIFWQGLAMAGGVVTKAVAKHPVAYMKVVRQYIEFFCKEDNIHRLEAYTRVDYPEGHKWLQALGFERENLLTAYGPDKADYYLYRRLF